MHADGAIHAVVDHHHDDGQVVLDGGGEFLAVHHEAAIAGEGDHRARRAAAPWPRPRPERHSPSSRRSAPAASQSRGRARSGAPRSRSCRRRCRRWCRPAAPRADAPSPPTSGHRPPCGSAQGRSRPDTRHGPLAAALSPGQVIGPRQFRGGRREGRGVASNAEAGAIDAVQFLRSRMNMHELRAIARNVEQRVALRRHFGEPAADQQHEIRTP